MLLAFAVLEPIRLGLGYYGNLTEKVRHPARGGIT